MKALSALVTILVVSTAALVGDSISRLLVALILRCAFGFNSHRTEQPSFAIITPLPSVFVGRGRIHGVVRYRESSVDKTVRVADTSESVAVTQRAFHDQYLAEAIYLYRVNLGKAWDEMAFEVVSLSHLFRTDRLHYGLTNLHFTGPCFAKDLPISLEIVREQLVGVAKDRRSSVDADEGWADLRRMGLYGYRRAEGSLRLPV